MILVHQSDTIVLTIDRDYPSYGNFVLIIITQTLGVYRIYGRNLNLFFFFREEIVLASNRADEHRTT